MRFNAVIITALHAGQPVELIDIAQNGCSLVGPDNLAMGQDVELRIGELAHFHGTVRWARKRTVGVLFDQAVEPFMLGQVRRQLAGPVAGARSNAGVRTMR